MAVKTGMRCVIGVLLVALLSQTAPAVAQTKESHVVESAITVLDQIMAIRLRQIPESLLADAHGVAIVPNVVKVSFIAGLRRGRGVLLVKNEAGAWIPPQFVTLTGGSIGYQVGLQATDVILVFKTRKSIQGLLGGTLTLGADAAVAAGPVGRNAGAATDAGLKAEIYTYSRSRGLFAGVSLDGTVLEVDQLANSLYYNGPDAYLSGGSADGQVPIPASAARLMERVAKYTGSTQLAGSLPVDAFGQAGAGPRSEKSIRHELANRSLVLYAILDDGWKSYLALPGEVFGGDNPPSVSALSRSLSRFDAVAAESRYRLLTQRQEFQAVHGLLREYVVARTPKVGTRLQLPPPPVESPSSRR